MFPRTRAILVAAMVMAVIGLILLAVNASKSDASDIQSFAPKTSQEVVLEAAPPSFTGHPALNQPHPPLDHLEVETWCKSGCDYVQPVRNNVYIIVSSLCNGEVTIPTFVRPMRGSEQLILQHSFKALTIPVFAGDEIVFSRLCAIMLWVDGPLPRG